MARGGCRLRGPRRRWSPRFRDPDGYRAAKDGCCRPLPNRGQVATAQASIFSVVEEEEEEPPKKTMDARFQYSTSKSKPKSKGEAKGS